MMFLLEFVLKMVIIMIKSEKIAVFVKKLTKSFYSHFINFIPIYLYCTHMTSSAKPVHEYFKHLQYLRHKTKLATI